MLKTFRSTLRKILPCLLLALALMATALPATPAHAGPAAPAAVQAWIDGLLDTFRAWMPAPVGVATSASDAGPSMDPNGIEADAGGDMDPDGYTATAGPDMDPNGGAEAGGSMDPNG